ncbi:MAG: site-specific integrase [Ferruginibacter sp.]|nr:site-specific integrase [Ferruginibacter sp.]
MFAAGHYSTQTAKNYLTELRYLFSYYADCRPSQLTYHQTVDYLIYLTKTLGCSRVKSKMAAQSFAFFFKHVLQKPYQVPGFLFPARDAKLPVCMPVQDVITILNAIDNVKHKMIISLIYSTGLRLKEAVHLRIEDIDSKAMCIKVVEGKGKKDRFVALSNNILTALRAYYLTYKPLVYLFNGTQKGKPYTSRSVQHILEKVLHKTNLQNKGYSIHTLRHSYATHLLKNGADLPAIKQLMGHHHLSQTMQYVHISTKHINSVVNPCDVIAESLTIKNK